MATCSIRWRPSGGRGEFEYVPMDSLRDRDIEVFIEALDVVIPAEVRGVFDPEQKKPRLRKFESNNRKKLHLPQLVMAIARMPEPKREDISHTVSFPLENKSFVLDEIRFEIISDDGAVAQIAPLAARILHAKHEINLEDRLNAIKADLDNLASIAAAHPDLATAISDHGALVMAGENTIDIRKAADRVIALQSKHFGMTNAASVLVLEKAEALPATEEEAITGKEGRILTRIHVYKERDRTLVKKAKAHYKAKGGGKLKCQSCGMDPVTIYGSSGERCIEAHHTIPIEELQPDSITRVEDMAMVCASCHRIIHSQKPCLKVAKIA